MNYGAGLERGTVRAMSNSTLATYTRLSPNRTSPRNHKIDTITIHCMAGNLTVERCGEIFAKRSRMASSNYGIGSDGRIGLYVEECNRSWCSSNRANDMRAITIEVANDGGAATGWHVSDAAMAALIELLVDICKRNDIKKLLWKADKKLIGQIDKQNMTVHRWFKNKACPGDYLFGKHSYIANEVNKRLGAETCVGTVEKPPENVKKQNTAIYYARYSGAKTTLYNALKSLGIDASFSHRKLIAIANGMTDYKGTAEQNTKMYNLLCAGLLEKEG